LFSDSSFLPITLQHVYFLNFLLSKSSKVIMFLNEFFSMVPNDKRSNDTWCHLFFLKVNEASELNLNHYLIRVNMWIHTYNWQSYKHILPNILLSINKPQVFAAKILLKPLTTGVLHENITPLCFNHFKAMLDI